MNVDAVIFLSSHLGFLSHHWCLNNILYLYSEQWI